MTLKTAKPFRMTRAYLEGYFEGRFSHYTRNPYDGSRQQEINDWEEGRRRGKVLRHFHEETPSGDAEIDTAILRLRRQTGEKV